MSLVAVLCLALWSRSAAAEPRNPALAEQLFKQGKDYEAQGKLREACDAFAASHEADPSVGAILNLARCHEQQGKSATAWAEYKAAARLAAQRGEVERERGAKEFAAKLEGNLSKLTVLSPEPAQDVVVKVDGQVLPAASLGRALPVDPGDHTVKASGAGYESWDTTVTVAKGGAHETVKIPPLRRGGGFRKAQLIRGGGFRKAQLIAGAAVAGVGVTGLLAGAVLGGRAIKLADELRRGCPQNASGDYLCGADVGGQTAIDELKTTSTQATALVVTGSLLTAAGGVVMLTSGRSSATIASGWQLAPVVALSGASLWFSGTF